MAEVPADLRPVAEVPASAAPESRTFRASRDEPSWAQTSCRKRTIHTSAACTHLHPSADHRRRPTSFGRGVAMITRPSGSRSRSAPSDRVIWLSGPQGMIVRRVVASALLDLPPAFEPAVVARPVVGVQRRRTTGAASRSRCIAQSQPEAPSGLGGSSGLRCASPGHAKEASLH
jgi:hypothetical protein